MVRGEVGRPGLLYPRTHCKAHWSPARGEAQESWPAFPYCDHGGIVTTCINYTRPTWPVCIGRICFCTPTVWGRCPAHLILSGQIWGSAPPRFLCDPPKNGYFLAE